MLPTAENVLGAVVAISIAKKVTVYGVARIYGFPRLYRKSIKFYRRMGAPPEQQLQFRDMLKVRLFLLSRPPIVLLTLLFERRNHSDYQMLLRLGGVRHSREVLELAAT